MAALAWRLAMVKTSNVLMTSERRVALMGL
jgi:hypothetical protein